jgi:hypothetical protein
MSIRHTSRHRGVRGAEVGGELGLDGVCDTCYMTYR